MNQIPLYVGTVFLFFVALMSNSDAFAAGAVVLLFIAVGVTTK